MWLNKHAMSNMTVCKMSKHAVTKWHFAFCNNTFQNVKQHNQVLVGTTIIKTLNAAALIGCLIICWVSEERWNRSFSNYQTWRNVTNIFSIIFSLIWTNWCLFVGSHLTTHSQLSTSCQFNFLSVLHRGVPVSNLLD